MTQAAANDSLLVPQEGMAQEEYGATADGEGDLFDDIVGAGVREALPDTSVGPN